MNNLALLFSNNILPIFLAAGTGFLAAKYLKVNARSISKVAFFIFSPCLIFTLITTSQLGDYEVLRMASYALVNILVIGAVAWVIGRLIRLERRLLIALLLSTMFVNAGNYGLSLNLFAFGEPGLAHASIYFVISAILMYTLGVVIASLGKFSLKDALVGLLKIPIVYAVILGMLFTRFEWQLPLPFDRTVTILGNAAIPVLMVLMGIQLAKAKWNGEKLAMAVTNSVRLVAAPLLAILLSTPFGLHGVARQAGILEASMPTAVISIILATEYDVEPGFVTMAVVTTTLLSPLTLTPLLAYLGA
ncbi:MAG: AEC family transporter [Anaerolineales bacterium]